MVRQRLIEIAFLSDTHATRGTLGVAELVWAITLFWPGETFSRPTYEVMRSVMPEEGWGLVFLVTAVVQFGQVLRRRYHGRSAVVFAAWSSVLWWFTVLSMYASVYPPPAGISGELALSLAASWVLVKSGYIGIHKG